MKTLFLVVVSCFLSTFAKSATVLIESRSVSSTVCESFGGDSLKFTFRFQVTALDEDIFVSPYLAPSVTSSAASYSLQLMPLVSRIEESPIGWFELLEGESEEFVLTGVLKPSQTSMSMVSLRNLVLSVNGVDKYLDPFPEPMQTNYHFLFRDVIPEPSSMILFVLSLGFFTRQKR